MYNSKNKYILYLMFRWLWREVLNLHTLNRINLGSAKESSNDKQNSNMIDYRYYVTKNVTWSIDEV